MSREYFLTRQTDSAIGRKGIATFDWSKSIAGFDPNDWDGYVAKPPTGTNWQDFVDVEAGIHAHRMVSPFALCFLWSCNLVIIDQQLFDSLPSLAIAIDHAVPSQVHFDNSSEDMILGSVRNEPLTYEEQYSARNRFFAVEQSKYHMHGTKVERDQCDVGSDSDYPKRQLSYPNLDAFLASRREVRKEKLTQYAEYLELKSDSYPDLFSTRMHLYVSGALRDRLPGYSTPGICCPYEPIEVSLDAKGEPVQSAAKLPLI